MPSAPHVSLNTRITLSIVVVTVPLFVWAGRLDARVEEERGARQMLETRYDKERADMRQDLRDIQRKLDDIRERIPLVRPRP